MAKGPKTLNPADKARKEARKKELKKNKKQRQQVRSAAIECRDPQQIISELEHLDRQEFDIEIYKKQSSSGRIANDILLKDKRKRLKELYAKILAHYEKEDPEKHATLKALEATYESKYKASSREFEAVKAAQEVRIEDVFLPPDQSETKGPIGVDSVTPNERTIPSGQLPNFKQLLANNKSSSLASNRFIPANLRNRIPHSDNKHRPPDQRMTHRQTCGDKQSTSTEPKQGTNSHQSVPDQQDQSKPAVIESKPVIFVPKVTKFVPASVRSKLGATKK